MSNQIISETLHYIGKNHPDYKAVQIGAMDGLSFDDTRAFFDIYEWQSILVEPVPEVFEQLKENLKNRKNLIYEQSAIGPNEGRIKMLTIPKATIEEYGLHPGYGGMSAAYPLRNGFGSDYARDIEVKSKFGKDIEVDCITFDQLLQKHNFDDVNILVCDAEGMDWEIFQTINLSKYNLQFIRLEYINLSEKEKNELKNKFESSGYVYEINGQDIDAVKKELYDKLDIKIVDPEKVEDEIGNIKKDNCTIVSGLWNISREGREFEEFYLPRFKEFLQIPNNMFLFLPKELHSIVWEIRSPENTQVKTFELEDLRNFYDPHWNLTQKIRNSPKWYNLTGEGGWLKTSPQAANQWYNPIVQSKMSLLHDASLMAKFNSEFFYWVDAGITYTVPSGHLIHDDVLSKLPEISDTFLFLSYPYEARDEIHGFEIKKMNQLAGSKVNYVCRGGLFGGHKDQIKLANGEYYALLQDSLRGGFMGTEESLFTIMSYLDPASYRRFMLDGNGLIVKFTEAVIKNNVVLEEIPKDTVKPIKVSARKLEQIKTNLYMLTFNFPKQVEHTINSMKKVPDWLEKPNLYLLDNSTNNEAREQNKKIAEENNFTYISLGENKGICGGRQAAAEHFHESDADYMFFFEDDMTVNSSEEEGKFCRKGFRKYIPGLYNTLHKIILKENLDFLKLSFSEVYWDNNIQTSWYNVPQSVRSEIWPNYDKLPVTGIDPNAPRTKFEHIEEVDGVSYITGEIFYCNWPMIVSKEGNQKMFIDTKWAHPYEQTWMSHIFQETLKGNIRPGVLLASPIWHDRIAHYTAAERREN